MTFRVVLASLLLCPTFASATLLTMTFDDPAIPLAAGPLESYTENGITATGRIASGFSSGSLYIGYGVPPYSRSLDFTTGGLFTPVSVDLDPLGSGYCGGPCAGYEGTRDERIPYITISGYLENALTGQLSFYKSASTPFFTMFLDLLGEVDLLRIDVGYDIGDDGARTCDGHCGHLRIDNLTIDAQPVPEPETLALLALGVIGAALSRKRKQTGPA